MSAHALAVVALLAGTAMAQGLDVDLGAYRKASGAHVVGVVSGRAYAERPTPAAADQPLTGTVIVLVPRSAEFVGRLERIKAHARDSQKAFLAAATEIRLARESYEKRLWEASYPDLVRATTVDPSGAFSTADLPAGDWLLIATRSVFVSRPSPKATSRERQAFPPSPRLVGYYAVSVWLRKLTVTGGGSETVELADRNVWFTGVVEDRMLDAGP